MAFLIYVLSYLCLIGAYHTSICYVAEVIIAISLFRQ